MNKVYIPPISEKYTFAFLRPTENSNFIEVARKADKFYLNEAEIGDFSQLVGWMMANNAHYVVPVGNGYYCWEQVFFNHHSASKILQYGHVMHSQKTGVSIRYSNDEQLYVASDGHKSDNLPEGIYCIDFMQSSPLPKGTSGLTVISTSERQQTTEEPKARPSDSSSKDGRSSLPPCRFDLMVMLSDGKRWRMTWSVTPGHLILYQDKSNQIEFNITDMALFLQEKEASFVNEDDRLEAAIIDGDRLLEELRTANGHLEVVEIKNRCAYLWNIKREDALELFQPGQSSYFINPFVDVTLPHDCCLLT